MDEFVDILIANEDEARAFTGHTDERRMIESLSSRAEIAVLKVGSRGSYISQQRKIRWSLSETAAPWTPPAPATCGRPDSCLPGQWVFFGKMRQTGLGLRI